MNRLVKILVLAFFLACLNVYADTTYIRGNITPNTTGVAVRVCASKDCAYVKDDKGEGISISYPEMFEIIGEDGNFYKIKLQYTGFWYEGYVSKGTSAKAYVEKKEYLVTDELINAFKEMGFDDTYAIKLAKLKVSHPNWTFIPYEVNATFDEVIEGETKYIDTNLIDKTASVSLRSTEDGAYDNGVWKTFSGGWYAASKQTVRYYVDPRNFLNDGHVFMFESLNYNNKITEEIVQSALNGTFMAGDTFYYNDNNEKVTISYSKAFIENGSKYDVSALGLANKVIQEQGNNGSALSSGDDSEYPGYYNFFNIRANGATTREIIHNGLAYAVKKGWNSPYASIGGGAALIHSYNDYGQNTLYLQKFDFAGNTYYTNQYMQNIRDPYSSSYHVYKIYVKKDLLDSDFTFVIPVFKGTMPAYTSLSEEYNEDTTLSMLEITGCSLMPSFTSSAHEYTCSLGKDVEKVKVTAVPTTTDNVVEAPEEVELKEDQTDIVITVTSASGEKGTYKVVVIKTDDVNLSPDEILSKLQINNNSGYLSGFDLGEEASSLNDLIKTNYPTATSEIDKEGRLSTGMTLKLKNNGESTYKIVIYGDNNGDGEIDIIDLLKIQKNILGANKLEGAYFKASDINKDGEIDIIDLLKVQKHLLGASEIAQ